MTAPRRARSIADAVAPATDEMKAIIARGHHAEDFGNYGDFFHEPLASAPRSSSSRSTASIPT